MALEEEKDIKIEGDLSLWASVFAAGVVSQSLNAFSIFCLDLRRFFLPFLWWNVVFCFSPSFSRLPRTSGGSCSWWPIRAKSGEFYQADRVYIRNAFVRRCSLMKPLCAIAAPKRLGCVRMRRWLDTWNFSFGGTNTRCFWFDVSVNCTIRNKGRNKFCSYRLSII